MKDNFDINVCYKKVFRMLGNEGTMDKMVNDIAEYTNTVITIIDIGGKILSASDGSLDGDDGGCKEQREKFTRLVARYIDVQEDESSEDSMLMEEEEGCKVISRITVKGNTEGFSIMESPFCGDFGMDTEEILCQVNDILCQAVGILMERYGHRVYYHASTLRRMIARSFFDEEAENGFKIKEIRSMYDAYVLPGFIVAVLEMKDYHMFQLQKAANGLADEFPDSFIYMKENRAYVLFSGVRVKHPEKKIRAVLEELCKGFGFYCGMSGAFDDVGLVEKKHFLVKKALEIGKSSEPEKGIYMEYDYYIQTVCSCAVSFIGKARYLEEELQELKNEDCMKGTCFYNTLKEYLLNGNNVSMTSKKLFIHRNTMIYRLGKINEILGVDINAPSVAWRLMLSIILQEQEWGN
ncbi:helix-turn-helix domain-containing protein [Lachnospiraceae bacterium 48-21]|nr:hypothetical protein [Dorea sp.]